MNSIAYEMGAVFLLAAMLMFGSAHGFIPRSLRNAGAPIVAGVLLVGFLIWRFGPDLWENARSNGSPWFASSQPAPAAPASSQPASSQPAPAGKAPAPRPAKSVAPGVTGIVIREVVPAPTELSPAEPAPPVIVAGPIADKPVAEKPIGVADAKPAPESSGSSPYDSGVKRAVESVGRFLHIGGKKAPAPQ
jgi:hypothetical protein